MDGAPAAGSANPAIALRCTTATFGVREGLAGYDMFGSRSSYIVQRKWQARGLARRSGCSVVQCTADGG